MGFNPHFQLGLDVLGRRCLVVGGGDEAADKTERLLAAGATPLVVAPDANATLREHGTAGRILLRPRPFRGSDARGVALIINTARDDRRLVDRVWRAARRHRVPINTFDTPDRSTVAMAAQVARGHLRISVSTSNASPALAGRLRAELARLFDDELEEYLAALGEVRAVLREREPDPAKRRRLLTELVDGVSIEGRLRLPADWRDRVATLQ